MPGSQPTGSKVLMATRKDRCFGWILCLRKGVELCIYWVLIGQICGRLLEKKVHVHLWIPCLAPLLDRVNIVHLSESRLGCLLFYFLRLCWKRTLFGDTWLQDWRTLGRRRVEGEIVNMVMPGVHIWTHVLYFQSRHCYALIINVLMTIQLL